MTNLIPQPKCKRLVDIVGSLAGLTIGAPLLLLIAVAIKLTSRGPVFYLQRRVGRGGASFVVFKFRTMRTETVVTPGHETRSDDPRITPAGRWLRHTGLDELPQLANVLLGQMSLVGPRPLLQWEIDLCEERQRRRLRVKPGLTGLSQVNGRNSLPWNKRIEWDLRYAERASFFLDFAILLRTVPLVLRGGDAYAESGHNTMTRRPTTRHGIGPRPEFNDVEAVAQ